MKNKSNNHKQGDKLYELHLQMSAMSTVLLKNKALLIKKTKKKQYTNKLNLI